MLKLSDKTVPLGLSIPQKLIAYIFSCMPEIINTDGERETEAGCRFDKL